MVVSMIAALGLLAVITDEPFLFASAGPTAIIAANNPYRKETTFSSITLGHAFGLFAGIVALLVFGLYESSRSAEIFSWSRLGATSLAMGATAIFSEKSPFPHPPAGATTLLISLGILSGLADLAIIMIGIVIIATITVFYKWLLTSNRI